MKTDKFKPEEHITGFIVGHDDDDHYNIQGDLEILGIM
jgi:hypothetical protein